MVQPFDFDFINLCCVETTVKFYLSTNSIYNWLIYIMNSPMSNTIAAHANSAKEWEEGMDALSKSTNSNLSKIREFRSSEFQDVIPDEHIETTYVMKPSNSGMLRSSSNGRPSSASRAMCKSNSMTSSQDRALHHASEVAVTDIERKIEVLLRKSRVAEDRIKKLENMNAKLLEDKAVSDAVIEQLCASTKSDHQLVLNFQSQIYELKRPSTTSGNVGGGCSGDAPSHTNTGITQGIDMEAVQDIVYQRVHKEFQKVVAEVVRTCASQQAEFLQKWSVQHDIQHKDSKAASAQDLRKALDQEISRHRSDVMVLSGKINELEAQTSGLSGMIQRKDAEIQKKMTSMFRSETHSVIESVGRKVNEALSSASVATSNAAIREKTIEKSLEQQSKQLKNLVAWKGAINDHLGKSEHSSSLLLQHMDRFDKALSNVQQQVDQFNGMISHAMTMSAHAEDGLSQCSKKLDNLAQNQKLHAAEKETAELRGLIKNNTLKIDSLLHSMSEVEARVVEMDQSAQDTQDYNNHMQANLMDSGKKLTSKVRELIVNVNDVIKVKRHMQDCIAGVEARAHNDAQWSYQFQNSAASLDRRVSSLENRVKSNSSVIHFGGSGADHSSADSKYDSPVQPKPNPEDKYGDSRVSALSPLGASLYQSSPVQSTATGGGVLNISDIAALQAHFKDPSMADTYKKKWEVLERERSALRKKYDDFLKESGSIGRRDPAFHVFSDAKEEDDDPRIPRPHSIDVDDDEHSEYPQSSAAKEFIRLRGVSDDIEWDDTDFDKIEVVPEVSSDELSPANVLPNQETNSCTGSDAINDSADISENGATGEAKGKGSFNGWLTTQLSTDSIPTASISPKSSLGGVRVISKQPTARSLNAKSSGNLVADHAKGESPKLNHRKKSSRDQANKSKQRGNFQSVAEQEFYDRY